MRIFEKYYEPVRLVLTSENGVKYLSDEYLAGITTTNDVDQRLVELQYKTRLYNVYAYTDVPIKAGDIVKRMNTNEFMEVTTKRDDLYTRMLPWTNDPVYVLNAKSHTPSADEESAVPGGGGGGGGGVEYTPATIRLLAKYTASNSFGEEFPCFTMSRSAGGFFGEDKEKGSKHVKYPATLFDQVHVPALGDSFRVNNDDTTMYTIATEPTLTEDEAYYQCEVTPGADPSSLEADLARSQSDSWVVWAELTDEWGNPISASWSKIIILGQYYDDGISDNPRYQILYRDDEMRKAMPPDTYPFSEYTNPTIYNMDTQKAYVPSTGGQNHDPSSGDINEFLTIQTNPSDEVTLTEEQKSTLPPYPIIKNNRAGM